MNKFFIAILLCLATFVYSAEKDDFDLLMGKNSSHWSHVKQTVDLEALTRYKKIYERQQGLRHLKSSSIKIPKIVHFIWLGPRSFPGESVQNVRTWMAQNPDWTFKFWTDRPRDPPCHGMEMIVMKNYPFPGLGRCYETSDNWGEKSDVLRFEILYHQGGVYVDHDANCLQPFEGMHGAYDFYCCLEVPHPVVVGLNITAGNGVVGSRPGHPVIKQVIDLIDQRWDELAKKYPGKDEYSKTQIVMERTYLALTLALREKLNFPGNSDIVLPAAYFFAKSGIKPLYSQHFFANSWAKDSKDADFEKETQKILNKLDKKLSKTVTIIGAFLSFNLLLIAFGIIFTKKLRLL
jgi:hypothetical protein